MTDDFYSPAHRAAAKAQASNLKEQASSSGLLFESYFVPDIAKTILKAIENGHFTSPDEAVFVAMQSFLELSEHPDLRQELLKRSLQKAIDDPRPSIPADEVFAELKKRMEDRASRPPARWEKIRTIR